MEMNNDVKLAIATSLEVVIDEAAAEWEKKICEKINDLLVNNMNRLITLLYRMDINEQKLRLLLKENIKTDAAAIILQLMIKRQIQKIKSRQQFRQRDNDINEEDKW